MSNTRSFQGALTDKNGARAVAKRLFQTFDLNNDGLLDYSEISPIITNAYSPIYEVKNPSQSEIKSFIAVFDRKGKGCIDYEDLESMCFKYLLDDDFALNSKNNISANVTKNHYIYSLNFHYYILDEIKFKKAFPKYK